MSLLRKFLFTDESPKLVLDLDKEAQSFGPTYGNRRANGKQFRAPWSDRGRNAAKASSDAGDTCETVGCG
jgi:hypothetical protein